MKLWRDWVLANSLAELVGLGGIGAVGFGIMSAAGEPQGTAVILVYGVFVALGAYEGWVVGVAQSWTLRRNGIPVPGWLGATVIGAVVAWAIGMMPSTIMNLVNSGAGPPPPDISQGQRLLFASALGVVAGPALAYFQWRALRGYISHGALWWLPANSAAWALGMPIVFAGVHIAATANALGVAVAGVCGALLLAGATVGAVHGLVLVCLVKRGAHGSACQQDIAAGD